MIREGRYNSGQFDRQAALRLVLLRPAIGVLRFITQLRRPLRKTLRLRADLPVTARRVILLFLLSTIHYSLSTPNCCAEPISSTELIEHAKEYNNTVVEYEGEVVGDVMARGEFAWVNVNDGRNAIGVWGKKAIINNIVNRKGDYNCKGDVIRVNGIFHRACPEHGGDLDIHVDNIIKVKDGFATPHPAHFPKFAQALGLAIVALGLSILYAFKAGMKPWKTK